VRLGTFFEAANVYDRKNTSRAVARSILLL
jgi:hypothetical protein